MRVSDDWVWEKKKKIIKTTQTPKSIKKKKKPQIAAKIVQSLDELWRTPRNELNRTGRTWCMKGEDKLGSLHHDGGSEIGDF